MLTFVAKATFDLQPGKAQLAADQEPIHELDCHWDDDGARSVYAPSDLVPLKSRVDVLLVGSAHAPKGQAVRSLFARLIVGDLDKSIEVHADRMFAQDGSLVEAGRFSRMSLAYERAAGGPDTMNPIGVRLDARDAVGRVKLPNLQPPGLAVHGPGVAIAPIGFGPLAESWPWRFSRLGRHAGNWSLSSLGTTPLPDDIDRTFFNSAPTDQQLAELSEDARIVLENLHPEWPRLVTSLPGLRPRAILEGRGGHHPLKMRADTLWIDTDRAIACLTFRSHRALERFDEPGRINITLEEGLGTPAASVSTPPPVPTTRSSVPDVPPVPQIAVPGPPPPPRASMKTLIPGVKEEETVKTSFRQSAALPFLQASTQPAPPRDERLTATGGLPFGSAKPAAGHAIADERTASGVGLPFFPPTAPNAWPGKSPNVAPSVPPPLPPRAAPPGWPVSGAGAPPPPVPSPVVAPPPPIPPAVVTPVPPAVASPPPMPPAAVPPPRPSQQNASGSAADNNAWGSGISQGNAPAAQSIGQVVVAAATAAAQSTPQDATTGVLGASNGAAGPSPVLPGKRDESRPSATPLIGGGVRGSSRLETREVLHLVWYHADSVARICKVPLWRSILQEMEQKPSDDDLDDPAPNKDPIEIEDTRDIFEIMARAASEDVAELGDELNSAIKPGNKFIPPLLLLAGELSFPFDERETLKVAVAIASPLAATDEALKTAIREAKEFLAGGADQVCPGPLADGHTTRIRDIFQRGRRSVSADTLDIQIERALLEGRHYQKRQVLGMNAIRALLHSTTGNSSVRPAPVYIPEDIAKKLPLYQRFRARIIAELYFQEDQYELHPAALKLLAMGRVQVIGEQRK